MPFTDLSETEPPQLARNVANPVTPIKVHAQKYRIALLERMLGFPLTVDLALAKIVRKN